MRLQPRLSVLLKLLPALLILGTALHAQEEEEDVVYRTKQAPAPSSCSAVASAGTYAVVIGGFIQSTANGPYVPTKAIGTITFDSGGTVSGSGTVTLGGKILTDALSGTATVNADCTGTASITQTLGGSAGPSLTATIVVEAGGVVEGLITTPQTVLALRLKKIS
jgi:hypothetical protein